MPQASTIAINVIVGSLLLLSGAVYVWSAFSMHGGWQIAGTVALAVLSIVVGLLLLAYPLRIAMDLIFSGATLIALYPALKSAAPAR